MVWSNFKNYGEASSAAFEILCNHLFERYVKHDYATQLKKMRMVNGRGGDGGLEAYAELLDGSIIGIQSKWFRDKFDESQISQIRSSINMAKSLRPKIKEYIVCIPIDLTSLKNTRGSKIKERKATKLITMNSGDQLIDFFC